jgi:DNA-binding transcriptional LysR family regulator
MRWLPDLTSMAFFIRIVEEGSISAAGRALGLPKATVSRRLATLEKRIGAPLIARSTRAISLTDAGRRFYERIGPIIREAEAAQSEMVDASAAPSGLLRVTASVLYGQAVVAPKLLSFAQRYPDVGLIYGSATSAQMSLPKASIWPFGWETSRTATSLAANWRISRWSSWPPLLTWTRMARRATRKI